MYKKIFTCILWGIAVTGCVANPNPSSRSYPYLEVQTGPIRSRPLQAFWKLAGDPQISGQDYRLVIHAIQLSGQTTLLLYSLAGTGARQLAASADIQVVDDQGQVSLLIAAVPVLERPGLPEVGGLRFERRVIGANELYLRINPKQGDGERLETRLAWFERPRTIWIII